MGRPLLSAKAKDYFGLKPQLWEAVHTSLDALRADFDIVVVEGAGSPAEINLKKNEIVNMRVARYANAPVLLCGDIDRGGIFAFLVGTLELLEPEERELIKGFIINKFRGDPGLLTDGITWLEERTGIPVAGLVHYYRDIHIPEEDSVALDDATAAPSQAVLDVAVIQLPHISNFDDFDPLARHSGVELRYVDSPAQLGRPDLVIIPGTKTTIPDLAWMNEQGLSQAVKELHAGGAAVIGVCGGYQMLGTKVSDPEHIESSITELDGLGLLDLTTVFEGTKETHRINGRVVAATGLLAGASGMSVSGYEIHMGRTVGEGISAPFRIEARADVPVEGAGELDGALDASGSVMGTYIHGLFHNGELRTAMLNELARRKGVSLPDVTNELDLDREYDKLADWVRSSLDMDLVYRMSGLSRDYDAARSPTG
jgi:adenosylcobyric acid synthase